MGLCRRRAPLFRAAAAAAARYGYPQYALEYVPSRHAHSSEEEHSAARMRWRAGSQTLMSGGGESPLRRAAPPRIQCARQSRRLCRVPAGAARVGGCRGVGGERQQQGQHSKPEERILVALMSARNCAAAPSSSGASPGPAPHLHPLQPHPRPRPRPLTTPPPRREQSAC